MKKIIIGLVALSSISALANEPFYLQCKYESQNVVMNVMNSKKAVVERIWISRYAETNEEQIVEMRNCIKAKGAIDRAKGYQDLIMLNP